MWYVEKTKLREGDYVSIFVWREEPPQNTERRTYRPTVRGETAVMDFAPGCTQITTVIDPLAYEGLVTTS